MEYLNLTTHWAGIAALSCFVLAYAVAIAEEHPDVIVYAARNRLYLTRDGGVFWTALTVELPEILGVTI